MNQCVLCARDSGARVWFERDGSADRELHGEVFLSTEMSVSSAHSSGPSRRRRPAELTQGEPSVMEAHVNQLYLHGLSLRPLSRCVFHLRLSAHVCFYDLPNRSTPAAWCRTVIAHFVCGCMYEAHKTEAAVNRSKQRGNKIVANTQVQVSGWSILRLPFFHNSNILLFIL